MLLLPAGKYSLLKEKIKLVTVNNLFARSVIEGHVRGKVFADNISDPQTWYIVHPYGMSLLAGDCGNEEFNSSFLVYATSGGSSPERYEWMQTFPRDWDAVLDDMFGSLIIRSPGNDGAGSEGKIEVHSRVNFEFRRERYLKRLKPVLSEEDSIAATGREYFEKITGSVIPGRFWDSAEDFAARGRGFTLFHEGEIASTAYSAFVMDNMLEIGIETVDKFRGRGFAELTCSKLIDHCLENNLIPVWACRRGNTASYNLALKLGFEPVLEIPFYRLGLRG